MDVESKASLRSSMSWAEVLSVRQSKGLAAALCDSMLYQTCLSHACNAKQFFLADMERLSYHTKDGVLEMSGDAGVEEINQISVSPHRHIAASAADDNRVTCWSFQVCVWLMQLLVLDSPHPETCPTASHTTQRTSMPVEPSNVADSVRIWWSPRIHRG